MQAWRESCSCPGSADERIRQDEAGGWPDFQEERAKYQRDYQLRQEAYRATRAKTAGKNREEIKDLYRAELCARGLKIPPENILDAAVDAMTGNYLPSVRLLGKSLATLGKLIGTFLPPPGR
jgi:hypothetical protein